MTAFFSSDSDDEVAEAEDSLVNTIYSPIIIDLDGDGLKATHFFDQRVGSDLDGDGAEDQTAWLDPADAFLCVDLNDDGEINSGAELFGGKERGTGYSKLAAYDSIMTELSQTPMRHSESF